MGEKLNEEAAAGGQQAGGGATSGAGTGAQPGTGTGTGTGTPPPTGAQGGGGSQADQTGPDRERPTGEVAFPDGSRTRVTEDGKIEHTDASGRTGQWSGDDHAYWDPQTNEWMPDGWGDPGFENRPSMDASDWEHYAGGANDARRLAQEAGDQFLADWYGDQYDKAVSKARELRGN